MNADFHRMNKEKHRTNIITNKPTLQYHFSKHTELECRYRQLVV